MKKNKKGFTLIELLVVVAIIGILAGLLIPGLMNKTVDAKIKTANSNAKLVYSSTANVLQQGAIDEASWMPTTDVMPDGQNGATIATPGNITEAIQNELRAGFKGYWAVSITKDGDVKYAVWSTKTSVKDHVQMTDTEIKDGKGKIGCYPSK